MDTLADLADGCINVILEIGYTVHKGSQQLQRWQFPNMWCYGLV